MKFNNYEVIEVISSGSFGNVYKCKYNNKIYAVKEDKNFKLLKHEANMYKCLLSVSNVSNLHDFFTLNNNYYLVLDNYEITLDNYKLRCIGSHDYYIKLNRIIGILIDTLKKIHDKYIIHRDLKPSNICFDKNMNPYIIDFGLSKKYYVNSSHIMQENIKNIIGSNNFVSLNVVNLITPSRRDDLESIIFIYIYMILNNNAYYKYSNLKLEYKKDIVFICYLLKNSNINKAIIDNIYHSLTYIRGLNFSQLPDYTLFKNILLKI